jgi:hypothetical protein
MVENNLHVYKLHPLAFIDVKEGLVIKTKTTWIIFVQLEAIIFATRPGSPSWGSTRHWFEFQIQFCGIIVISRMLFRNWRL